MTQLENELHNVSQQNSLISKVICAYGNNGTIQVFLVPEGSGIQAKNSAPCKIYNLDATKTTNPSASTSEFDKLIKSLEVDSESANQLSQARKWVSETFYNDMPTLASLRLNAGLSQAQLGKLCGIEQPHISRYESGKHEPSISVAAKMAIALNVELNLFFEAWDNTRKTTQQEANHD
ncbi:MAG: helix-turn-helix transcriptional regulator [Methylococcaceae bacterium]